ncbi:MAG: hypothetical protein E7302_14285 [Butyrivibrio sp.]|nr:hypothetical protein [Butyrivibrio sp.]
MNPVVSTDKIMEQIVETARQNREKYGVASCEESGTLKECIDKAASLYEYRYGSFSGGKLKAGIKKVLSLFIRPAARPLLDQQTELNKSIVQGLKQIQLSMECDRPDVIKRVNESVDLHEKSLNNMHKKLDHIEKSMKVFLFLILPAVVMVGGLSGCSSAAKGDEAVVEEKVEGGVVESIEELEGQKVAVIAHRGYPTVQPENTLSAFLAAMDIGTDYIELDVQQSLDEEIVVFHDDTMARVTGAEGTIADYTLAQLKEMDAGSFFSPNCAGEKIPTLDEVFKLIQGELPGYESIRTSKADDMKIYLELKDIGDNNSFVEKVVSIVEANGFRDRVIYASFNYDYLKHIKELDSDYKVLYNNTSGKSTLCTEYPADYYGLYIEAVNEKLVRTLHDAGSKVFVWTVDSATAMKNVMNMGVDGIVTNNTGLGMVAVNRRFTGVMDELESAITLPWLYHGDETDADYVVQGFTDAKGTLVVSAYDKKGEKNSIVYFMSPSGAYLGKADLCMQAHVGGIAYDEQNDLLWSTAADGHVVAMPWQDIRSGSFAGDFVSDFDAELVNHNDSKVASFIGIYADDLYVGSYMVGKDGILKRYDISDPANPVLKSEAEIPECIQGITIYRDALDGAEYMILSQSQETNDAHLLTFKYGEATKKFDSPIASELLPEGTENIQMTAAGLYVLFDSGSKPYRETAIVPNDKLYLLRR